MSVRTHPSRNFRGRFVLDGDWDIGMQEMGVLPVIAQLFMEGKEPQETDKYQRYVELITNGNLAWTKGIRTIDELDRHFHALIEAFADIRANGYRTQEQMGGEATDEVRICIDRHGEPCVLGGGTHRLSIAKLLRIGRIPVYLKRVHWVWVRDWMKRAETSDPIEAIRQGVLALEMGPSGPVRRETDRNTSVGEGHP